jgi:hypothetical protein
MEQGVYRKQEAISSKWRKMNNTIGKFIKFYNPLYVNPPSGFNEDMIFKEAMRRYEDKHRAVFPHVRAWMVLKTSSKWAPVPNEVASAKRTKTSESGDYSMGGGSTGHCQININDDPDPEEDNTVRVQEEPRPTGRDKAKRQAAAAKKQAALGSGSGSMLEGLVAKLASFKNTFSETQAEKKKLKEREVEEKLRLKQKRVEESVRQKNEDRQIEEWRIMTTNINDYPEEDRPVLLKMKESIAKKYNL